MCYLHLHYLCCNHLYKNLMSDGCGNHGAIIVWMRWIMGWIISIGYLRVERGIEHITVLIISLHIMKGLLQRVEIVAVLIKSGPAQKLINGADQYADAWQRPL